MVYGCVALEMSSDPANPNALARQRVLTGIQNYKTDLGTYVVANQPRETGLFQACFITTPDGATLPLSETTNYPGISWTLRPNSVNICHAELGPIDADMIGRWTMIAWFLHDGNLIEAQQPVHIQEEDGISTMPALEYLTHIGKTYDISLNRTVNTATCVLKDPNGQEHTLSAASTIPGVTFQNSDRYVICRVTIGPMDDSLIGEWFLIQKNTDNTERVQPVTFQWANPSDPTEESWFVSADMPRNILATTGSTVQIMISRTVGFFETCFLTTPDGDHLPMYGRNYPYIQHVLSNRISSCIVELGPLDAEMWGTWSLSARHDVEGRSIELKQDFILALDTGIRTEPRIRQWTHIGDVVDINLNQTGVSSICRLQAPNGIEYSITPGTTPLTGVTVHASTKYVSCRVTIGPMAETLLGQWVLVEQSTGRQRRQPVVIAWAHPANPSMDARQQIIAPEENFPVNPGEKVVVDVNREMGTFEGCFLTVPDGTVIPMLFHSHYPDISLIGTTRLVSCIVEIGPVSADMMGRYTLTGYNNNVGTRTESIKSFTILEDAFHLTHIGATIDINLNQTGSVGTCMLRNPAGQIFVLDSTLNQPGVNIQRSNKFVSCRVTIGPMTADLLGEWVLMHQITGQRERRIHATIRWANPWNPSLPSRQLITAPEQNTVGTFGDIVTVNVPWHPGFYEGCVITAPDGTVMPVSATNIYPGFGFIRSTSLWSCAANLGPLDDSMMGRWTLSSLFDDDGALLESQQTIILGRNTGGEMELPALEYLTNIGAMVDLSLDNINKQVESCRLLTPDGQFHILNGEFNVPGVTIHESSKFVSCRVTIGPMTEELLGTWTLIEHDVDQTHRRQAALFAWANPSNPTAVPRLMIAAQREIVADTGEIVNVFLTREEGFFEGCYITTPDGATLPLFPNMRYPGIAHAGLNRLTACFADLGPMDAAMVGRWTLAARFNNAGTRVETQLPMNVALGDGNADLRPIHELSHIGGFVDLNLNQTGAGGGCSLTTPDGQEHTLGATTSIPGVSIRPSSKFVSCRVTIGPMTEALLGDWVLTLLGSDQTRRTQPMTIAWANPADPTAEPRTVTTEAQQSYNVRMGTIISTSIRREDGLFEGCFLTTPDGTILPVLETNAYPGTIWAGANRITACFVQIGPIDAEELGNWVLTARTNNYGVRTELRIPIQVSHLQDTTLLTENLPRREYFTQIGGFVDLSLNETGSITGSCSLVTPAGQTYLLQNAVMLSGVEVQSNNQFVSCSVRIGPMTAALLGTWSLVQQDSATTERRQLTTISWAHPSNPEEPMQIIRLGVENVVVDPNTVLTIAAARENAALPEGCFITSPHGVTMPIFGDDQYPGIVHAGANRITTCFVDIGPITEDMVGLWTLRARFNRNGERIESQVPVSIELSSETTTLPVLQHVTNVGGFFDLSLNQTGVTGNCLLKIPSGQEYTLANANTLDGITAHQSSKFVSCRVVIGPMTEQLIGDWTLIQQFNDPHLREQPATIAWANPENNSAEVWDIRTEPETPIFVDYGGSIEISIPRDNLNHLFEGCFITTPDETVLPIFAYTRFPGITHLGVNRLTSCFVELGPVDSEMAGLWILAARFNDNGNRHENRQPFNLAIGSPPSTSSFNSTALIVCLTLLFAVIIAGVAVMSFKRSRDWSTQRFNRLRASVRSSMSRSPIVNDHELGSRT
ncbi:hypothetical protein MSG28_011749 [Choristoneura fumiferana]|uniref:Uncharacterized protein n=1 Tax=Choristoneura fumiferana TaxID=7141 RepID=A0ACC0KLH1_CHOFU|nr:hypothetical protein MSG28_011749 [Choristoneura fumiferana]